MNERRRAPLTSTLIGILLLCVGCHAVFGGFEEAEKGPCPASPERYRCNEEYLLERSQRSEAECGDWIKKDTCPSAKQCDATRGICLPCPTPGMGACFGAEHKTCAEDQTRWIPGQTCEKREFCGPTGCGPCTSPGELECSENETKQSQIRQCQSNGEWVVVSDCTNAEVCAVTRARALAEPEAWDRECRPVCPPGRNQFSCEGDRLQRCQTNGAAQDPVGACASEAFCGLMAAQANTNPDVAATWSQCPPPPCAKPGDLRCDENATRLLKCNADQTGFDLVQECGTGTSCTTNDGGDCIICEAGDYQCNGPLLQICQPDHTWTLKENCLTMALCQLTEDPSGKRTGVCLEPECDREEKSCGTPEKQGAGTGPILSLCNSNLDGWVTLDTCVSDPLCDIGRSTCITPCGLAGELRCDGLQLQECPDLRDQWTPLVTCEPGEFCTGDRDDPCDVRCPDPPFRCNGRFRQRCDLERGWSNVSECDTQALCNCALRGDCQRGVNASSCGNPVCGGSLPLYQCTGTGERQLQECADGRHTWDNVQRCDPGMCSAGTAPGFLDGACLACERNETRCFGGVRRTCSTDRRGWTGDLTCQHGCVDNGVADECAVCPEGGEARCVGNQVRSCAANRLSFVAPGVTCAGDCLNSGLQDYCAVCAANERRCSASGPGSTLQTCLLPERLSFGAPNTTCQYGCEATPGNHRCVNCTPVDDGEPCTTDICSVTGQPQHIPVASGTSCSNDNACDGAETCNAAGVCRGGAAPDLDDGNPCTTDTCSPATGVTHTPVTVGTSCSNGNACDGLETCNAAGNCSPGSAPSVNDGNPCTTDACDPEVGVTNTPVTNGTSCSNGNACDGLETCNAGVCRNGTPPVLDDENPCTTDACSPTGGVSHTPVTVNTSCADADLCDGAETCSEAGNCIAGTPLNSDDGNPCTADTCTPSGGVMHTPTPGASCADANECDGAERCNAAGICVAGMPPVLDDGNPCTADTCTPSGGVMHTPTPGASCADANECDGAERCNAAGICVAGMPPVLDDGNPCTTDACSPTGGVTHTPMMAGASCSNGNACDGAETCTAAGVCVDGMPPVLDDGNPCTTDACSPTGGVTHTPMMAGASCSNGNACDGAETCTAAGVCVAGMPPVLDDGNPCTTDACSPTGGVTHTPTPPGASCSNGNACDGAETCDGAGGCVPGTPVMCPVGEVCTAGSCGPAGPAPGG